MKIDLGVYREEHKLYELTQNYRIIKFQANIVF